MGKHQDYNPRIFRSWSFGPAVHGIHSLEEVQRNLLKKGIRLVFAQVGNRVWKTFHSSGFVEEIGAEWFHDSCHDAVQHCLAWDSSHIEEQHHYDNIEKTMTPFTKQ